MLAGPPCALGLLDSTAKDRDRFDVNRIATAGVWLLGDDTETGGIDLDLEACADIDELAAAGAILVDLQASDIRRAGHRRSSG